MRTPVSYKLDDGTEVLIEVEGPATEPGFGMRAATPLVDRLADQAERSLQAALDTVTRTAQAVAEKLRSMVTSPQEVTVEFGVKLDCKGSAIIASGGAEANFKVALKWTAPKDDPKPGQA